ncbi:MBOAT family O-acyltransferase [Capnocytophaga stomatis]|uniref:MBOAT family O-acyltransferase n=1 Tax=Capnocytophaga stomatis TaxID=1848904 RepID=A0ABW8Q9M7_9FLAO|nr:MBOAT family O-acyltransferase [Capnocytophaga stomatis]GIJ94457.1 alginate O-acetyltransferase [Capnocytophaga stomatis]GIM48932.1 alginate O-acetyltransferase [Capnocytophaga stomatis]
MNITNLQNWFFEHLNFTSEQVKSWFTYDPNNPLLFNSGLFLGMFLVFYLVYIITKKHSHFRTVYVILFSLFFYYKAGGNYFVLLVISSILDYFFAGQIHKSENPHKRKIFLIISMVANLGLLGYFKYTNFLIDSFNNLFEGSLAFQDIILPIGISFYTFQTMSYTIDVYRREIEPAKSFLDFTFFVCFFPQLVAGPIVRAKEFIPQIYKKIELTKQETSLALFLIIGGLLKKAVISDYISLNFVDRVFESPNSYTSFENLMAVYGYSLQIYCDFSGYSDMAIGLALLMGFTLPTNFRTPYQSQNITEFWRRWHISLSAWLKDYLYISVGGNRKGTFLGYFFPVLFFGSTLIWGFSQLKHSKIPLIIAGASVLVFIFTLLISRNKKKTVYSNFNQMTTMLLGGLWHGASLRFIVWGALHGLALAIHKTFVEFFSNKKSIENKETNWFSRIFFTFLTFHFVAFCWIFFRSKDFGIAMDVINNIGSLTFDWHQWLVIAEGYRNVFLLLFIGFVWHFFPQSLNEKLKLFFGKMPILVKSLIVAFVFWIVYATASSGAQPFIYFQF